MITSLNEEVLSWLKDWPDGIIAVDNSFRVVFISDTAHLTLGWTLESAEGKHLHDLLCSSSRGYTHSVQDCPLCHIGSDCLRVSSSVWKSQSGHNVSVDFRLIPLKSSVKTAFLLSFQNNLQANHSQSEMEKFSEYVDKNPEPIAEFDSDGQMIFGNAAMQEELFNKGFDDFGEALILPKNLAELCIKSIKNQEVIDNIEVQIGNEWYRWHLSPMNLHECTSVMGYAFNISHQKNMELQIEAEKAGARRDFFAKMVHELRTPLNAIIGFSQILLKKTEGLISEREYGQLKSIRAAGLQLNEMISDTLDISKIDAGMMSVDAEYFPVYRVLESFHDQLVALAEAKKLDYLVECDEGIHIHSDPKKVRQLIINLISNAIKYTRKGCVSVSVKQDVESSIGSCVEITVSDTGIGIPQSQINSLFNAYQRVSESNNRDIQGTGLGLALVGELIELLHGKVSVTSTEGIGSSFVVFLPLTL